MVQLAVQQKTEAEQLKRSLGQVMVAIALLPLRPKTVQWFYSRSLCNWYLHPHPIAGRDLPGTPPI
jgi:hypothetical protein